MQLVGDIGGTNARFAWLDDAGNPHTPMTLPVREYATIGDAMRDFMVRTDCSDLREFAVAVACPAMADTIKFTNNPWVFSKEALRAEFNLDRLVVVNDFTGLAMSVPYLGPEDLITLFDGPGRPGLPLAVIGAGTGLGVSGLLPHEGHWLPIQGEGGHVSLPAVDDLDYEIVKFLTGELGRVSAERILSGMGIENLYRALAAIDGIAVTPKTAAEVVDGALKDGDTLCLKVLERFCLFMGGVDFSGMYALLGDGEYGSIKEAEEAGAAVFAYGRFIMAIINFIIIAFVVFLLVKAMNKTKKKEEEAPAADPGPSEIDLLKEIAASLKK